MAMEYEKTAKNKEGLIDLIKELAKVFDNLRNDLCEPYGLSPVQSVIIFTIYYHPNENKVTDICKRLRKSTNTVSPLINRLVQRGFLVKVQDKMDARITNIELTEKTHEILRNISIDVEDYTAPMFDFLTDSDFDQIYKNLEKLLEATKK